MSISPALAVIVFTFVIANTAVLGYDVSRAEDREMSMALRAVTLAGLFIVTTLTLLLPT